MLLGRVIGGLIACGQLDLVDGRGQTRRLVGSEPGPEIAIRVHDRLTELKLCANPELYLGEAYMDERLTLERGTIYDLLELLAMNIMQQRRHAFRRYYYWTLALRRFGRYAQQFNPVKRARRNVAHHYDLSERLYSLFLDRDMQYSCAYFVNPRDGLDQAQTQKRRHIAAKLLLQPGQKVLDIGCGWGGMALHLAAEHGVEVTGITLSEGQLAVARRRARNAGLDDRVQFHLRDYRHETGTYDRIVSVGMFEHVGVPHYQAFADKVNALLNEDGVALLHSIGRTYGPASTNSWIRKYIFPGGYIPALSEVLPPIERSGLWVTDCEVLRLHYAETLRHWRRRFLANMDAVLQDYDERFCRMWEFYLAGSEIAFRHFGMMVFQLQMAHSQEAVPLTRDYVTLPTPGTAARPSRAA
jgi:cyclopropane-fatty-acyl-phospholipid synthase